MVVWWLTAKLAALPSVARYAQYQRVEGDK